MFRPCSTEQKLCSTVLDPSKICFDRARPKLGMFRLWNNMSFPSLNVTLYFFSGNILSCFFIRMQWLELFATQMLCRDDLFWAIIFHLLEHWFAVCQFFFPKISKIWKNFVFWVPNYPGAIVFFFDRARGIFRLCSTVLDGAQSLFWACSTVLEVCFDRARGVFRPCSRYVSNLCSTLTPFSTIIFRCVTDTLWKSKHKMSITTRAKAFDKNIYRLEQ